MSHGSAEFMASQISGNLSFILSPPPLGPRSACMAQPIRLLAHGARDNPRCLDDPPHPRLDLQRLYRCNQRIHQNPILFVNGSLSPQRNTVHPQKTVGESDSSTIKCG